MPTRPGEFGHGKFDIRVDVGQRQDEIGELAEAFNAMAESLSKSEERRTEFIANVSHELKTPMTTIAGFADGILDGTIPPEREKEYLQVISSETRRLSRLVRNMLDISRLRAADDSTAPGTVRHWGGPGPGSGQPGKQDQRQEPECEHSPARGAPARVGRPGRHHAGLLQSAG